MIAGTNQDEGSILLFMLPKILKAAGVHLPLNEETSDITMDFFFDKNVTTEIYQLYSIVRLSCLCRFGVLGLVGRGGTFWLCAIVASQSCLQNVPVV